MRKLWIALALTALAGGSSNASPIVYDNGPINGTVTANTINFGWEVSNSFTLGSAASLTGAQVGLWAFPGDVPAQVSWSIGTTPYGSEIGSGIGALTSIPTGNFGFGFYPLYESSFALPNLNVAAGTYYLTLENTLPENGGIYWDQNFGPSTAFQRNVGLGVDNGQLGSSHSFQIFGDQAIPEPTTLAVFGLMGMCGGFYFRRKSARVA